MTTATTTTKGNKVLSQTEEVKAILAKHDATKEVMAPLLNSNDVRRSNKEVIAQEIAKEQAKPQRTTKPAPKPVAKPITKPTKAVAKAKEAKGPLFTCSEAIGLIMKTNPKATAEVIINKADTLYIKKTGKESNLFQMAKYYSFAKNFMKGYNSK